MGVTLKPLKHHGTIVYSGLRGALKPPLERDCFRLFRKYDLSAVFPGRYSAPGILPRVQTGRCAPGELTHSRRVFRHTFFRLIYLLKIHSTIENSYLHIRYFVIYRLFIKQPCIDSFTKRYRSYHRTNFCAKYALFT